MPRHELNPFALFFGAIFCGLGVAYLVGEWTWIDVSAGWIAALVLIGLGGAGIMSATVRTRRRNAVDTGLTEPEPKNEEEKEEREDAEREPQRTEA